MIGQIFYNKDIPSTNKGAYVFCEHFMLGRKYVHTVAIRQAEKDENSRKDTPTGGRALVYRW